MMSKKRNEISNSGKIIQKLRETNVSSFYDNWGPEEVLHLYYPEDNTQAIVVIDHTRSAPSLGYIATSNYVTPYEAFRKARELTWCHAFFGLPFGGNCIMVRVDNTQSLDINSYLKIIESLSSFIPNKLLTYLPKELLSNFNFIQKNFIDLKGLVGKPQERCDRPTNITANAVGIGTLLEMISDNQGNLIEGKSPISYTVEGDLNLTISISRFVDPKKATLYPSDYFNTILADPKGVNSVIYGDESDKILNKITNPQLTSFEELLQADCDVLILTTRSIEKKNIDKLNCKVIINANAEPLSDKMVKQLQTRNITVIPNIISTGGERIATYYEFKGKSVELALSEIQQQITNKFIELLRESKNSGLNLRNQAIEMAKKYLLNAFDEVK